MSFVDMVAQSRNNQANTLNTLRNVEFGRVQASTVGANDVNVQLEHGHGAVR